MTDWLLALVPTYGLWLLAGCTLLSCLAVPAPASILLLAAGGFVASGDLPLVGCTLAALGGALVGDQIGYRVGRWGGTGMLARLEARAALIGKARAQLAQRGGMAVFLSRWLFSEVGPFVNLAAGAAGLPWARFTLWSVLGELLWVGLYIGVGHAAAGSLEAASGLALRIVALLGAVALAAGLGWWLLAAHRAQRIGAGKAGP